MKYQWLIFDADHTLFDFDRSEKAALEDTLRAFGLPADESIHRAYQGINKPLWKQLEKGQITAAELKQRRTQALFEHISSQRLQESDVTVQLASISHQAFLDQYLKNLAERVYLLPTVAHTLKALAGHCRMLILTNGIHAMQHQRLRNSGLADLFEGLVSSDKVGIAKPDKRIFQFALSQLGNPPREQVLMVGDKLDTDILGAHRAGLDSCWVHPAASMPTPQGFQPTHRITRLDQLLPIVLPWEPLNESGASRL